ncbi:lactate utilization protein B [Cellulomonas denverensis]|uniref:Lactate utilization protein n=1 Tax=Cellulomonas denverensis TaxID=264297 RepID=A0A7X6KTZ7_9CELL|nr:lactate utilization protein B [Cellulomonas denverensis]NKY22266.1 lactate utilization protein [Cellulomonas denverensis]GIG26933.1 iron-sulfur cluster-binding protein [Cellulomonas denverensis]
MTTFLGMPAPLPAHTPDDPLRWGPSFPQAAHQTLRNEQMRANLHHATHTIRDKRLRVTAELPDWEELREAGAAIKREAMARLPELLVQLEQQVTARGGVVHWARDAAEANRIVTALVRDTGTDRVVKVKSMATQEIGLNEYLAEAGITATETDLAELIVQLAGDMPSHILVPAIHRNRTEIRAIFRNRMDQVPEGMTDEPRDLAMAARAHLRRLFLTTPVAISGANMAIAETGTVAVYESEGNGRMCLTLPDTLITVMGIEKVLPRYRDLEVFAQLLPRSSTGERMNPYTSMWTGITPGDGPQQFHLVLLDNGRTRALADDVGRQALHCIRCSACLNVCPVYEHTSGHAYGSVYPGPIGAILTPQLLGTGQTGPTDPHDPTATLPFASSLCGACYEACPVKIDIPTALVHLRERVNRSHPHRTGWDAGMRLASRVLKDGDRFGAVARGGRLGRVIAHHQRIGHLPLPVLSNWTRTRDVPRPPSTTFRDWWAEHRGED